MSDRVPMRWPDWVVALSICAMLAVAVNAAWPAWITLSQGGAAGTYTDTTYVVTNVPFAVSTFAMVVAAALVYFRVLRRAGPWIAVCGAFAIMMLSLGMAMMNAPHAFVPGDALPRRYIDYPEAIRRLSITANVGAALSLVAFTALATLTLRALLNRRRST